LLAFDNIVQSCPVSFREIIRKYRKMNEYFISDKRYPLKNYFINDCTEFFHKTRFLYVN
jgi:hypothetical protein